MEVTYRIGDEFNQIVMKTTTHRAGGEVPVVVGIFQETWL
jgi:hypothetical protein